MNDNEKKQNSLDENPEAEMDFVFLTDQALSSEEELADPKFGHKEIAQALVKSIEKCPTPFTIGLFGKWGAGKSSIANILRRDLEKKEIPVVIFDVWKHQGDALRRTFLRECLLQLKKKKFEAIKNDFELNERLDKSVQDTSEEPILNIPWGKVKIVTAVIFIAASVFTLIDGWFFDFKIVGKVWEIVAAAGALVTLFAVLHYGSRLLKHVVDTSDFVLKRFVSSKAITYTVDKFADPQDFEDEFGRLITALEKRRFLVVFDNLDRVTHKRAIEVLTTIKTFLEPKDLEIKEREVVFLIPCDADAIREHIGSVYKVDNEDNSAFSKEEFLKKFFNAIFWIPEFIPTELESYTRDMLQLTKVTDLDNHKVAWLITKAYRENPRQVKQFINILLANYLLVRERQGGEGKDFPQEFLEKNIPQLTKFLLLYQRFPKDIEILRASRIAGLQDAIDQGLKFSADFKAFVNETASNSPINDVRIFFTLRISDQEKKFPGIEDFFINLEDGKLDEAEAYLERTNKYDGEQEIFSQVIKGKIANINNESSLSSFISTLLTALDNKGLSLSEIAYGEIVQHLTQKAPDYYHTGSPMILTRQIAEPLEEYRSEIIQKWHTILTDLNQEQPKLVITEDYWNELFSVIANHGDWFAAYKDEIREILSKRFVPGVWVAKLFKGKPVEQKLFLDGRFTTNFINSINPDEVEEDTLQEKIDLIFDFDKEILNVDSYATIVHKINELLGSESGRPLETENETKKLAVLKTCEALIDHYDKELKEKITDQNIWQNPALQLINGINQNPDWNTRKIFIPLALKLMLSVPDPQLNELREIVKNFINSATTESIDFVISKVTDQKVFIETSEFAPNFEERALSEQGIFDLLYVIVSDDKKIDWLLKLLKRDSARLLAKLKQESYKIRSSVSIVEALLIDIETKTAQEQELYFEAINAMKCGNATVQKDKYLDVLKRNLTNLDQSIQQVSFKALSAEDFLRGRRRRTLMKAILDWLEQPEVSDKYQPFSISAVQRERQQLKVQERGEFLQFIFEELIRKRNDEAAIRFGFDQLAILEPMYEERKENYEDIRVRIESEEGQDLKNVLIHEMKKLGKHISDKKNKPTREFWAWVESLSQKEE